MAEAFSIAAGIVGLASLGIQLGESVAKLAGACSTYKNASDDISALIASLQTFQQILEHVCPASQPIQGTHVPAQLLQECKEWCQDIKDGVNGVMTSIQDEIQQTPKWGKTRLIFRKSSVEQWLQKLQRSKLDLLLAHQIFGRYANSFAYQLKKCIIVTDLAKISRYGTDSSLARRVAEKSANRPTCPGLATDYR